MIRIIQIITLAAIISIFTAASTFAQTTDSLKQELQKIISAKKAIVRIAIVPGILWGIGSRALPTAPNSAGGFLPWQACWHWELLY